jgi:hypothetical protein
MRVRIAIIMACFGISVALYAQNDKIWFFGTGGGLKFTKSAGSPWNSSATTSTVAQPAGASPNMDAPAGCSVISQSNNDLAIYSNGNRDLAYDPSSLSFGSLNTTNKDATQSVLIVPVPGLCASQDPNCRRYIYFMTEPYNKVGPTWNGLTAYSVQMNNTYPAPSLSNSGSPISLLNNNTRFSEKLAAVQDGMGGIWVVAHDYSTTLGGGNTFYKIHLTPTNTWPYAATTLAIPNAIGSNFTTQTDPSPASSHSDNGIVSPSDAQGQMKFSKDGTKLALALGRSKKIVVFSFNKVTGAITYTPAPSPDNDQVIPTAYQPYGIEFSPLTNYLYFSETGLNSITLGPGINPYGIYQYGVVTATAATSNRIGSTVDGGNYFGSLQIGPDNKIYVARNNETRLAYITDPEGVGSACGFVPGSSTATTPTGAPISGTCKLGLPAMVAGMIDDNISAGPAFYFPAKACVNEKIIFNTIYSGCQGYTLPSTAMWNYGDGTSGTVAYHTYGATGTFPVTLTIPATASCLMQSVTNNITITTCPEFDCSSGGGGTGIGTRQANNNITPLSVELVSSKVSSTEYTFEAKVSGGKTAYSYQWLVNDKPYYTFKWRNKSRFNLTIKAGEALPKIAVKITDKADQTLLEVYDTGNVEANNTIPSN